MENNKVTVRKATFSDIDLLQEELRDSDVNFVVNFGDGNVRESLTKLFLGSKESYCALIDDEPYAIFGIMNTSQLGLFNYTWLAATARVNDVKFQTARKSKKIVNRFKKQYGKLIGFVDATNLISVAWHKWLGYDLGDVKDHEGSKFYEAVLEG